MWLIGIMLQFVAVLYWTDCFTLKGPVFCPFLDRYFFYSGLRVIYQLHVQIFLFSSPSKPCPRSQMFSDCTQGCSVSAQTACPSSHILLLAHIPSAQDSTLALTFGFLRFPHKTFAARSLLCFLFLYVTTLSKSTDHEVRCSVDRWKYPCHLAHIFFPDFLECPVQAGPILSLVHHYRPGIGFLIKLLLSKDG